MGYLLVKAAYYETCVGNYPTLLTLLPIVEVAVGQGLSMDEHTDAKDYHLRQIQ